MEDGVAKISIEDKSAADGSSPSSSVSASAGSEPAAVTHVDPETQRRVEIAMSIGEEVVTEDGLRNLFLKTSTGPNARRPICYDGFEPSGRMHIAQGILKSINVNKLTSIGCDFIFWVADWFAQLNNKLGGDLNKIQTVGKYFVEVWKACGMDMTHVKFLWASEEINKRPNEYWTRVMDVARLNKLPRIIRCSTIMGRNEQDELTAAQIFYPCMQCADIFFLKADICQLGMDQRKVNMLAREYCDDVKPKIKNKPIIISHHMMPGLKQGQEKMSKSDPESAIFMEDSETEVNTKIKKAFCPPKQIAGNPCIEYIQYLVMPKIGKFVLKRKEENGGDKTYVDFMELKKDYEEEKVHPGDLKPSLATALNEILQPVRDHFANDPEAKKLLETVKKYRVTS